MASDSQASEGLVHLYCGEGKGKTTAAVGLCARAAGSGKRVLFVQFFKDGTSSENASLRLLPTVHTMHEPRYFGRVSNMGKEEFEGVFRPVRGGDFPRRRRKVRFVGAGRGGFLLQPRRDR